MTTDPRAQRELVPDFIALWRLHFKREWGLRTGGPKVACRVTAIERAYQVVTEIVARRTLMGLSQGKLPTLLDIATTAEHLGVTERHVRRLVAERRIPFIKWGHLLRFDPAEIARWLDSMRMAPDDGVTRPR